MTLTEIIVGFAVSLTGGILAIIIIRIYRELQGNRTLFHPYVEMVLFKLGWPRSTLKKNLQKGYRQAEKQILRWLSRDQSKSGLHLGEFGKSASPHEEYVYQISNESLDVKPRLYLTGWPCFILSELGLGNKQIKLAVSGLSRYEDGIIRVKQGAMEKMAPTMQPQIVSIRHTIRSIQIFLELEEQLDRVNSILGYMLDSRNSWQNEDGGWQSTETVYINSDIWSSVYAANLLYNALNKNLPGLIYFHSKAEYALEKTLEYISDEWKTCKWSFGDSSSAQNGVLISHEVIPIFRALDMEMMETIKEWIKSWITPTGTVSSSYMDSCMAVTQASANARLAYALFLLKEPIMEWIFLYRAAISHFEKGLNSADASFLLHLTSHLRNLNNSAIHEQLLLS